MRERPILFSAPMVRAILEGRKTQTRRVVKPQPDWVLNGSPYRFNAKESRRNQDRQYDEILDPYGYRGDRLWVRETWCEESAATGCPDDGGTLYRATDTGWDEEGTGLRWRPSIFMPRSRSRITLEVMAVRVERLCEISAGDAAAEGVEGNDKYWPVCKPQWLDYLTNEYSHSLPRSSFRSLWESINGAESWEANPWVWVVEFRRIEGGAA